MRVGFVCHSGHLHPIAIRRDKTPADFTGTIDHDLLKHFKAGTGKIYFASDSDEICIADITPHNYAADSILDVTKGIYFLSDWISDKLEPINSWFIEKPLLFRATGCDEVAATKLCQSTTTHVNNLLVLSRFIHGK